MQARAKGPPRPLYQVKKHKNLRIQKQKGFKMQIIRVSIASTNKIRQRGRTWQIKK